MIKFNPDNIQNLTFKESVAPAMEIKTKQEADEYKKDYVAYVKRILVSKGTLTDSKGKTAEQIVNNNIGYYSHFFPQETIDRVNTLFETGFLWNKNELGKPPNNKQT